MEFAAQSPTLLMHPCSPATTNLCLGALDGEFLALLAPFFHSVDLARGQIFEDHLAPMILFPLSGIITSFFGESDQKSAAIAMVGHEGIANLHLLFSPPMTNCSLVVHVTGEALAIKPDALREMLMVHQGLHAVIFHYAANMHAQIAATLRSTLRDPIVTRLARLLLMYHDRVEGNEIPIFHSTMAGTLAVRRASITDAMHILEGYHAVRDSRGRTTITNRDTLGRFAAGS